METILSENPIDLPTPMAAWWDERLAHLISDILCPPLVALIGLFLFVSSIRESLVWVWALVSVVLSIGIPVTYVFWKVRSGEISNFHIPIRTQRFRPMLLSILCILFSWAVLRIYKAPAPLISLIGVSAALAMLLLLITLRWKISGHSIAIASLAIVIVHVMGQAFLPALLGIPLVLRGINASRVKTTSRNTLSSWAHDKITGYAFTPNCTSGLGTHPYSTPYPRPNRCRRSPGDYFHQSGN